MKTITLYQNSDEGYADTCTFAQNVYKEQLSFTIMHFPELLFAIHDEGKIVGCMGFNKALESPLFTNDPRVEGMREQSRSSLRFGEQSIFAVRGWSAGVPLLIAVVANYASSIGIDMIVYAGIEVSMRTIEHLGFRVTTFGRVDLCLLPSSLRANYESWNEIYRPITCALATDNAEMIASNILERFSHRVRLSEQLTHQLLHGGHTKELMVA